MKLLHPRHEMAPEMNHDGPTRSRRGGRRSATMHKAR
jgi:hypothetical protein